MARVVPESRLRERRRRRRSMRIAVVCGLIILFFGMLVALSRASFLRISSVTVSGTNGAEDALGSQVQLLAEKDLAGAYGHLFARNNIFLYPKKAITKDLLTQFPELKTVTVEGSSLHALSVVAIERTPVARWCGAGDAPVSESSSVFATQDCFLLDQNGLAYTAAGDTPVGQFQTYFGAATSTVPGRDLPKQYLTPSQFASLAAFVGVLGSKVPGDALVSMSVDGAGDVRAAFASGFELRFLLSDNAGEVLRRFALAQTANIFKTHKLQDFLYLDLRFGDRIYYKLKTK